MQRFSDNNSEFARICVDYKTKKVHFSYLDDIDNNTRFWGIFMNCLAVTSFVFFLIGLVLLVFFTLSVLDINFIPFELLIILALVVFFGIPVIMAEIMYLTGKGLVWLPKAAVKVKIYFSFGNMSIARKTYLDSMEFVIPFFRNFYLEYKAYGEFAKYLEKLEIKEHDFDIADYNIFTKRTTKREKNKTYWLAVFSFSEVPKQGELIVYFI